ncbi:hypothetical protein OV079_52885 [Nannocystis pusilla]|uniref:Cytochrome c domain-containing protein n=1 Tax=Nannocystis pusilla TaxID=889268 RepID=A0A9X3F114_9BACT|nr:hypothetical protein [Nannocystis pusilla]MCY1014077.1 hypothetical protein [Nannocystis pusilla]
MASALLACGAPDGGLDTTTTGDSDTGAADPAEPPVSYTRHVAPILARHCVACHKPGSIAPFVLDDYAAAAPFSAAIVAATAAREMPPFSADNSGACGASATPSG